MKPHRKPRSVSLELVHALGNVLLDQPCRQKVLTLLNQARSNGLDLERLIGLLTPVI